MYIDANKIREICDEKDLSQREIAERMGLPQTVVSRYQTGRTLNPKIERAESLASALGVHVSEIAADIEGIKKIRKEKSLQRIKKSQLMAKDYGLAPDEKRTVISLTAMKQIAMRVIKDHMKENTDSMRVDVHVHFHTGGSND